MVLFNFFCEGVFLRIFSIAFSFDHNVFCWTDTIKRETFKPPFAYKKMNSLARRPAEVFRDDGVDFGGNIFVYFTVCRRQLASDTQNY